MKARAKTASMITDGGRFEEIFQKHTTMPDSEPGYWCIEKTEFLQSGRDEFSARDERKETF